MIEFELHITTTDLKADQLPAFEALCASMDAKPILIELSEGTFFRQPMISKLLKSASRTALEDQVNGLSASFQRVGFPVERIKIEVAPWHREQAMELFPSEPAQYFEWHGKVQLVQGVPLRGLAGHFGGHLSHNALRNTPDKKFITLREYNQEEDIRQRIEGLKAALDQAGVPLLKEELEYCVFDSNISLDKGWIDHGI